MREYVCLLEHRRCRLTRPLHICVLSLVIGGSMATEVPSPVESVLAGTANAAAVFKYQDRYSEATLVPQLATRMAGRPANGVTLTTAATVPSAPTQVVWVDAGSDILVHLDSIKTKLTNGSLLVSVDLECDQVGRSALIVAFGLGQPGDPAGLIAVTDALPRGNGLLAARWGSIVQSAVWAALLGLLSDYSAERSATASGFAASTGVLQLLADTTPATLTIGALK